MGWVSVNLTAKSKWSMTVLGYCSQTHSFGEIAQQETRHAKCFCTNEKCYGDKSSMAYYVSGMYGKRFRTSEKEQGECVVCGWATYWSRKYHCEHVLNVVRQEYARAILDKEIPMFVGRK